MIHMIKINEQYFLTSKLRSFFEKKAKHSTFLVNTGDTEYDMEYCRESIKNGKIKDSDLWIFWLKHEAYLPFEDNFNNKKDTMHVLDLHNLCKELNIEEDRVVFINSDLDLSKNYDTWFTNSGFDKKINCIGFPWYFLAEKEDITQNIGKNPYNFVRYEDRKKLPSKRFISLNGTYNQSRKYIIDKLRKYQSVGYLSDLSNNEQIDDISIGSLVGGSRSDEASELKLDRFHKDSYFSIVNEAGGAWKAFNQDKVSAFFTEKITKPLYYGQPFILIGCKNSYKHLKNMGFEVYDDIFNITYDNFQTWEERTISAWKEIERVLSLSDNDFHKMFSSVQDKIIYNQERFFNYDGYVEDFINTLKELK